MCQQHLAATTKASAAEQTGMHKANIRVIIHSHSNDAQHTQAPESVTGEYGKIAAIQSAEQVTGK